MSDEKILKDILRELKELNKSISKFDELIESLEENNEEVVERLAHRVVEELESDDRLNLAFYKKVIDLMEENNKDQYRILSLMKNGIIQGVVPRLKGDKF